MRESTVTRFAPSPTGYLHIGGARTALFSWLYARKTNGKFILRIEDTDLKRNTPTATRQVINDLHWLGIEWDEGPEVDGPNGPYYQSQRKEIYDSYVRRLLEGQKAYYCFDTADEIEQMRQTARKKKQSFFYPRPETFPTDEDAEKARRDGRPVTVRFALPKNTTFVVDDEVRGRVSFNASEFGDFIIQKSDGYPTYNFACTVDDELMGITHIIRGQEHLMNTPCQQAIREALGFGNPSYAHMSVTVSEDGGKLSKREKPKALRNFIKQRQKELNLDKLAETGEITIQQLKDFLNEKRTPDLAAVDRIARYLGMKLPEINVVDFFRSGYLPEALVNFIGLLGFSPGGDREIMPISELIKSFDLQRLTKSNSLFDRKKLLAFNTEQIRMLPMSRLLQHFKDYLNEINSPLIKADEKILKKILELSMGARTLEQIEQKSRFLYIGNEDIQYDSKAVKKFFLKHNGCEILRTLREKIAGMEPLTEENIENMLRSLAGEKQLSLGKIAQPLRVALCGNTISLPIFDSVKMLGKENTLKRIDIVLKKFAQQVQK